MVGEEEARGLSSTRQDSSHWRGRELNGDAWVYADSMSDLAKKWGIDSSEISRLAGVAKRQPSARLAAKYEVEQLRERSYAECSAVSNDARRDAAFEARLDAV